MCFIVCQRVLCYVLWNCGVECCVSPAPLSPGGSQRRPGPGCREDPDSSSPTWSSSWPRSCRSPGGKLWCRPLEPHIKEKSGHFFKPAAQNSVTRSKVKVNVTCLSVFVFIVVCYKLWFLYPFLFPFAVLFYLLSWFWWFQISYSIMIWF